MLLNRAPLEVFGPSLVIILLLLLASIAAFLRGGIGEGWRAFGRLIGGFLALVVCFVMLGNTVLAYQGGKHSVVSRLENKRSYACGRRSSPSRKRSTCYEVRLRSGQTFSLPKEAYNKLQINGCYRFTYYGGTFRPLPFMNWDNDFVASIVQERANRCTA